MPVSPVKPVTPGTPPAPVAPLKPAALTPATPLAEPNAKTGTTVVKSAPPKETARITVKPNLPAATPVRASGAPTPRPVPGVAVAAAAGAVAGAAATEAIAPKAVAKGGKPATTIVKTGTTKVTPTSVKAAAVGAGGAVAPVGSSVRLRRRTIHHGLTTGAAAGLSDILGNCWLPVDVLPRVVHQPLVAG